MKRWIHAATTLNSLEVVVNMSDRCELSEDYVRDSILSELADSSTIVYVDHVEVNLGVLSVCDIRVYSVHSRVSQCRVIGGKIPTQTCFENMLRKLSTKLPEFVERNKAYEASDDKLGRKKSSSQIRKIIREELGAAPFKNYPKNSWGEEVILYSPYDICKYVDENVTPYKGTKEALMAGIQYLEDILLNAGIPKEVFNVGYNSNGYVLVTVYKEKQR